MSENTVVPKSARQLCQSILDCLEDNKGQDIKCLEVADMTTVADYMVLVTGTSSRHVRALAVNTINTLRDSGIRATGMEGEDSGDWVLIDFGDVIVHVMQEEVRSFYDLESLWQVNFDKTMMQEPSSMHP